jgi:hypothetical protein
VFVALAFGGPLHRADVHKVNRALLARETGWTYRHIEDEMDFREVEETLAIYEAVDKARDWVRQRDARKNAPRRAGRGRR